MPSEVALIKRYGWVRDTLHMLDEAKRLTHGEGFAMRWMSGLVRAQLPGFFGERETALADLMWCTTHADIGAAAGLAARSPLSPGSCCSASSATCSEAQRQQLAQRLPRRHQAGNLHDTVLRRDAALATNSRHARVREPVPGTVYTLSGFEFTEYHFVVSADRRELIAIDAGTRPDAAREALEALRALHPGAAAADDRASSRTRIGTMSAASATFAA